MKKINCPAFRDKYRFFNGKHRRLHRENNTVMVVVFKGHTAICGFDVFGVDMLVQLMQPVFRHQRNAEYRYKKCRNELTLQLHVDDAKLEKIKPATHKTTPAVCLWFYRTTSFRCDCSVLPVLLFFTVTVQMYTPRAMPCVGMALRCMFSCC